MSWVATNFRSGMDSLAALFLPHCGKQAADQGLVVATSGNISMRLEGEGFVISAAGARLGALTKELLVELRLDGETAEAPEGRRPSRETPLHRAIYSACPEVGAILHFQSPAATVLACMDAPLPDLNFIPEVPVYLHRVGEVPYLPPGSAELADAVAREVAAGARIVVLRNHGQVAVGSHPLEAVDRAAFFELAARIYLESAGRFPLRRFTPDEVRVLESYDPSRRTS